MAEISSDTAPTPILEKLTSTLKSTSAEGEDQNKTQHTVNRDPRKGKGKGKGKNLTSTPKVDNASKKTKEPTPSTSADRSSESGVFSFITRIGDDGAPINSPRTIPKKTAQDKMLDRLETILMAQDQRQQSFQESVLQTLSAEKAYGPQRRSFERFYTPEEDYSGYEHYYGDEDGEEEDYPYNEFEAVPSEEEIEMEEEQPDIEPKEHTEILPEAVCNEIVKKPPATNDKEKITPTFASKYGNEPKGEEIDHNLASIMTYLLTNRLDDKVINEVLEKYNTPKNCEAMDVPKVNAPIWDGMSMTAKNNDLKLQKMQKNLMKATIAFTKDMKKPTENEQNALACLAAANFELNMIRRDLIKPGLQSKFAQLCKPSVPVTKNLFGDELSRHIRDLSEVHRATGVTNKYQRYSPYRGRGRGSRRPFLGRGLSRQSFRRPTGGLTARRGRGRGAPYRGQQSQ